MQVEIATLTRQGGRDYNEDCVGQQHDDRYLVCLVADGAGGHGGGDVAAAIVRDSLLEGFFAAPGTSDELLRRLVLQANRRVVERQQAGGRLAQMRSTVVLAVLDLLEDRMRWVHSGDSRAYLFRGGAVVARTSDHSLVQQMVDSGMLGDEQARLHPQRNVLLSALGAAGDQLEISVSEPMRLQPGDAVLLCSDGVWEVLGDEGVADALQAAGSARQWAAAIDHTVAGCGKPGQDNYSAFLLWVHAESDAPTQLL
ncbi:MAG TPA: protein phosphatase 2C domain-containing protein [Xanthomonadaceae bacterium]|nr:protein phosphatase 2C domain-containing protein [Xanthomonadaceae bacterium]